jgi:ankyrin repeat protein
MLIMSYDLHALIRENKVEALKEAIEKGADINARDQLQDTPLLYALERDKLYGNIPTIECLLQNGADINVQDQFGCTPLMKVIGCIAYGEEVFILFCLLLKYKANVRISNGNCTALHLVFSPDLNRDNITWIQLLLENGADINARDRDGKTVLHHAIEDRYQRCNTIPVIEYLLQSGADINAQDEKGFTPLMVALDSFFVCKEPHIALLLRYNPDVMIKDKEGRTAVSYMYDRTDLSDSIKGVILLRSVPGLRHWRLEPFINAFRMQSPFPGELYNAITPEFIALVHPEIPLDKKLRWLEAYDEKVLGIGKEQASKESEQALSERCNRP